ncbi:MAG: hypothetical protein R3E94_03020 [Burkholderiaceae bacterium]
MSASPRREALSPRWTWRPEVLLFAWWAGGVLALARSLLVCSKAA